MALFAAAIMVALIAMFALGYFAAALFGSVEVERSAEPPDSDRVLYNGRSWEDSFRERSRELDLIASNDNRWSKSDD